MKIDGEAKQFILTELEYATNKLSGEYDKDCSIKAIQKILEDCEVIDNEEV